MVIAGGSLAGCRAAEALRREGFGAHLTIVGAERDWPPYDRPPLSKQVLSGRWDLQKARLHLADDVSADLRLGSPLTALDLAAHTVVTSHGDVIPFDGLVVATGARPRSLPSDLGGALNGVTTLRTAADSVALRDRFDADPAPAVAVVGAGFIGSEVAASARGRGCRVTVIEALPQPLARVFPEPIARRCARLHRDNGTDLNLGTTVDRIDGDGGGWARAVTLGDGTTVEADVVVVGIGVTPSTEWLQGSGLVIEDGVVCDDRCIALGSGGTVVAAGDVARWPNPRFDATATARLEHWTNAAEQAEHAAAALLRGDAAAPYRPIPYFWSEQYGTRIMLVGVASPSDEVAVEEGDLDGDRFVASFRRNGRLLGALCWNYPNRTVRWRERLEAETAIPPGAGSVGRY